MAKMLEEGNSRPAGGGEPDHGGREVPGLGRKILVVDDEPRVGRVIAHAAEACGCTAALAISAPAFRARYELETPDAVLLDLSLPGCDGVELLRFLAERESKAAILIVSGFDGRVIEAAVRLGTALGLNMAGSLTKPVTVRQLGDALAAAFGTEPTTGDGHELCL